MVANWKMALSHKAALEAAGALKKMIKKDNPVETVLCPSFPSLAAVAEVIKSSEKIQVGAQNVHWEEKGAWTGEVSVLQIKPFVRWCIVGHSERREYFGETNEHVITKMGLLLKHGITPVVCVGENRQDHQAGQATQVVAAQVRQLFAALTVITVHQIVLAYEPIWAISSDPLSEPDDPEQAAEIMLLIRKIAVELFGRETVERLRILYGGSVTEKTVEQFMIQPGIDGVLVGGASVRPLQLGDIIARVGRLNS